VINVALHLFPVVPWTYEARRDARAVVLVSGGKGRGYIPKRG
jgi:hypothetical protein